MNRTRILLCAIVVTSLATLASAQLSFVLINEVLADPPSGAAGDANRDGTRHFAEDEFVEILNIGPAIVDISGWRIGDDDVGFGGSFAFPAGTELAPGACALLFGGGIPTGFGALTFTDDGTIGNGLGNSGECVFLWDGSAVVQDMFTCMSGGPQSCQDNTSLTRVPEGTPGPFAKHDDQPAAMGADFSPGARIDGSPWEGGPPPPPPPPTEQLAPGELIITEIMQNPRAVFDSNGEYFEIYNATERTIALFGQVIRDDDFNSFTVNATVDVGPGEWSLFARNGDPGTNGGLPPVDFVYGGFFLGNSSDEVIIDSIGIEIDRVEYDNGATFPDPNGASMELKCLDLDNNVGANWRESTSLIGGLAGNDFGTPGADNDVTPPTVTCSVATDRLWPPNHRMVDVGLSILADDDCDVTVSVSVSSDEHPGAGSGGSKHSPDATVDGTTVRLRAERNGTGDGRVYVITVTAMDGSGHSTQATCTVGVPHNRKRPAVDSGQSFDPTQ